MRARPFVPLQSEPAECGLVAVAALTAILGAPVSAHYIRERYGVSTRGSSVSQLIRILRDAGFSARAVLLDPTNRNAVQSPTIALWEGKHFVVLVPHKRMSFDLFDPESGWRRIHQAEVQQGLSGMAIEASLEGAPVFPRSEPFSLLAWLARFRPGRAIARIAFVAVAAQIAALALPMLSKDLVDQTITPTREQLPVVAICLYGVAGLIGLALSSATARLTARLSTELTSLLTLDILRRVLGAGIDVLMRSSPTSLYGKVQTVQSIQHLVVTSVTSALVSGVVGIVAVGFLIHLSPELGGLILAVRAVAIVLDRTARVRVTHISEKRHRLLVQQMGQIIETLRAAPALFAAGAMRRSVGKTECLTAQVGAAQLELAGAEQSRSDAGAAAALVDQLVYLGLGTLLVASGTVTLGSFVAVGLYRQFASTGLTEVQRFLSARLTAQVALGRLDGIVDTRVPAPTFDPSPLSKLPDASVEVAGVWFRYSSFDDYVLSNLNLSIRSGECVAIVGASGTGKSTLAKLLTSMLRPTRGTIAIGGVNLTKDTESFLLPHIGTVLQNDTLISASIRENIRLYRSLSDSDVERAAQIACIDDFIRSLPMRYETPISDDYGVISGGQRQRILLARAIVSSPKLLVMDEATSALDPETERRIAVNIRSLPMTRIIFAHRLETIRSADRVLELATLNGNVAHEAIGNSTGACASAV